MFVGSYSPRRQFPRYLGSHTRANFNLSVTARGTACVLSTGWPHPWSKSATQFARSGHPRHVALRKRNSAWSSPKYSSIAKPAKISRSGHNRMMANTIPAATAKDLPDWCRDGTYKSAQEMRMAVGNTPVKLLCVPPERRSLIACPSHQPQTRKPLKSSVIMLRTPGLTELPPQNRITKSFRS